METIYVKKMCNGINCDCPIISKVEKEGKIYYIIEDDFGRKSVFTEYDFKDCNFVYEKINEKEDLFKVTDVSGASVLLTQTDCDMINEWIEKEFVNEQVGE